MPVIPFIMQPISFAALLLPVFDLPSIRSASDDSDIHCVERMSNKSSTSNSLMLLLISETESMSSLTLCRGHFLTISVVYGLCFSKYSIFRAFSVL